MASELGVALLDGEGIPSPLAPGSFSPRSPTVPAIIFENFVKIEVSVKAMMTKVAMSTPAGGPIRCDFSQTVMARTSPIMATRNMTFIGVELPLLPE